MKLYTVIEDYEEDNNLLLLIEKVNNIELDKADIILLSENIFEENIEISVDTNKLNKILRNGSNTINLKNISSNNDKSIVLKYPSLLSPDCVPLYTVRYEEESFLSLLYYNTLSKNEEKEIDYKILEDLSYKTLLFSGETGSGKTYTAIHKCLNENKKFIISVPTRQLAADIYLDYKDVNCIFTGEVSLSQKKNMNAVCVYEHLCEASFEEYEVLIVDEAHYLGDEQRGAALAEIVIRAIACDIEVIFLTATDTLSKKQKELFNVKTIMLETFRKVQKIEINVSEVPALTAQGKNIIVFVKYSPNNEVLEEYCELFNIDKSKAALMTADVPTSKRLLTQIAFKNGDLQLIVSTNVLAQGVNLPADIVVIEYNEWDDWEIVKQKVGRAGRAQYTDTAYVVKHYLPEKKKKGIQKKREDFFAMTYKGEVILDLKIPVFQVPKNTNSYSGYKYSKAFLYTIKQHRPQLFGKEEMNMLTHLEKEEQLVNEILLTLSF